MDCDPVVVLVATVLAWKFGIVWSLCFQKHWF